MKFDSSFDGKIIQVTEALDYGDAVSNQVIALDGLFKKIGLNSTIYSKWHHENVAQYRTDIETLSAGEKDILIYHFYGHSEFALPEVLSCYCTKILVYHNITPHDFFEQNSSLHDFCRKGREQLRESLRHFHYFWGASNYNLDELRQLGASPDLCTVIPIIVPADVVVHVAMEKVTGDWLFVGRIAANKGQLDLIELFASVHAENPALARKLDMIGSYQADDPYFKVLLQRIMALGLEHNITLTGKVSDAKREEFYRRASVYVSMSRHEGFGVPLIEAPLRGLPVVALDTSAVGETMGHGCGVVSNLQEMKSFVVQMLSDSEFREKVLAEQNANSLRFTPPVVERSLIRALRAVLPKRRQFRTVSIVICTYNRRDHLERVLDYLRYQSCPCFEVIVVNGPSDDGTQELLESYSGQIKIAQNPKRNLSISRNLGIELADADIVAFIDDDAIPFDDWVETILKEYNSRPLTTAGLGGPAYYAGTFWFQAEDNGINKYSEAKVNIASDDIGRNGWSRYNTGTNATFKNNVLRQINGFDEQFEYYLDESELCFRIQIERGLIGYSKSVVVRHEFAQSHNRNGKHNYNWFSICKNTAYFIAVYSGLKGHDLRNYIHNRMQRERIVPLDAAHSAGEITGEEYKSYTGAIWQGVDQGLKDAAEFPRTRSLKPALEVFRPFNSTASRLRLGSDLKRLHVCILSKEFPPFAPGGGVGTLYYHLASELLLMGHEVTVVVPAESEHLFEQGRFRVVFAKKHTFDFSGVDGGFASNLNWSLSALHALTKIHEQRKIDVVDTALWDVEALAFAMIPACKRPPLLLRLVTPYPVAARVNQWQVSPNVASLFIESERTLIARADAVVPISESIADTIEHEHLLCRDNRWHTIPCGIAYWPFFDVNQGYAEFQELDKVPHAAFDGSRLIVFVGRLERRKGIDLLLQATEKILRGDENAHILIAGRDVENWVQRSVHLLPNEFCLRVHFMGEVSDATREKLLARAYCLVFPSRYESFGLVPLEAFVHGIPVVASRSGAIPEVVVDGVSGLLFEAEDANSLAQCVLSLLRDAEMRQHLSDGARERVRQLSSRKSAITTVELYAELISNGMN